MIRVCLGCRDPDLQYIHQNCIDKYLSNLPPPPTRRSDAFNALQAGQAGQLAQPTDSGIVGVLEFLRENAPMITGGFGMGQSAVGASYGSINDTPRRREASPTTIIQVDAPPEALPTSQSSTTPTPEFYCTRCRHPYNVKTTPIHPVKVMISDPFLRYSILLMFICIIVLTVCCGILLYQYWGTDTLVWDVGISWLNLRMDVFAGSILVVCHFVNALTWWMCLDHCGGRTKKSVVGIPQSEWVGSEQGQVERRQEEAGRDDEGSSVASDDIV